jgi:hypothetical protein
VGSEERKGREVRERSKRKGNRREEIGEVIQGSRFYFVGDV